MNTTENIMTTLAPARLTEMRLSKILALWEHLQANWPKDAGLYRGELNTVDHYGHVLVQYSPVSDHMLVSLYRFSSPAGLYGKAHFPSVKPDASFQCSPTAIIENNVTVGHEPTAYVKHYARYMETVSGALEWKLVYSTAPRTLRHFGESYIPTEPEQLRYEMIKAMPDTHAYGEFTSTGQVMTRLLKAYLLQVDFSKFGQPQLSDKYLRHLRDNIHHLNHYIAKPIPVSTWKPQHIHRALVDFINRLNAESGSVDDNTSESYSEFRKFAQRCVAGYKFAGPVPDQLRDDMNAIINGPKD